MDLYDMTYYDARELKLLAKEKLTDLFRHHWELEKLETKNLGLYTSSTSKIKAVFRVYNQLHETKGFDYYKSIADAFEDGLEKVLVMENKKSWIAMCISHQSLKEPIYLSLKSICDVSCFDLLSKLYTLTLFKEENILSTGHVTIELILYKYDKRLFAEL